MAMTIQDSAMQFNEQTNLHNFLKELTAKLIRYHNTWKCCNGKNSYSLLQLLCT